MDLKNLESLISPRLDSGTKITNIESKISDLQGFGSVMIKLKVTVQDQNGKQETLHLVGKRLPKNDHAQEALDIQVSFKKEVQLYQLILPTLQKFQSEEGVSDISKYFAKFYGARYNLNGTDDKIDNDGILLLEDLCERGLGNINRKIGFDLKTAEVILRDLAKFHGTVIALKFKKPEVFERYIKPLCIPFRFMELEHHKRVLKTLGGLIETFPEYSAYAHNATNYLGKDPPKPREPFSTIIQNDLWVNNIMNKIGADGNVENIFVDFQIFGHRSAVADVFFFLWTSVQEEVLKHKIDHLLKQYHTSLLDRLKEFSLETSAFAYDKFDEELRIEGEYEFGHSLMFAFFIKFLNQVDKQDTDLKIQISDISAELKNFIHFMVSESVKRKWLN